MTSPVIDNPCDTLTVDSTSKPIIGLVGGIGSGKSEAARILQRMGCAVIDADQLARQALESPQSRNEIVGWWGPGVIRNDGSIDRQQIARIVFSDPQQRQRLEGLTHPQVHQQRRRLREQYLADPSVVAIVEDCPLLMETGLDAQCDVIIWIEVSREIRVQRLQQSRGWDEQELDRREKSQLPLDIKRNRADYVLKNDGAVSELTTELRRILSLILQSTA